MSLAEARQSNRTYSQVRGLWAAVWVPGRLLWPVVLVGLLLRLYRFDVLSLWVDEGLTTWFARLPWDTVLGFHGAYETHPPLYFALVKAAETLAPEITAGRLVSVVAGTLTLPVVYALGVQLLDKWAALAACVVLAVSPLHIWYSQEARPYATVVLFVGIAYLALIMYYRSPGWAWAAIYGIAVALSLYTEYSAVYALAPQLILLLYISWKQGRVSWRLWGAGAAAVLVFLPWVPQVVNTAYSVASIQESYLGVSPDKVGISTLSVTGIAGSGSYFWGGNSAWDKWLFLQPVMLVVVAVVIILGIIALRQRSVEALIVGVGLFAGTIAIGAALSIIRAGYAERTILSAVVGWALLAGAVPFTRMPKIVQWMGALSVGAVVLFSLVTLRVIYQDGDKQHWRDLAQDSTAAVGLGQPLVVYPAVAGVLLDIYQASALDSKMTVVGDGGDLPALDGAGAIWLAYVDSGGIDHLRDQLAGQGYVRLIHRYYWNPLYLDFYALPEANLGSEVDVNGLFSGAGNHADGWQLPVQGTSLQASDATGRELVMQNSTPAESSSARNVPAHGGALYTLSFEVRSQVTSGQARSFLLCTAASGAWTLVAPDDAGEMVPNDGAWHTIKFGALCPAGTTSLTIDLRNGGQGEADYRDVKLWELIRQGK